MRTRCIVSGLTALTVIVAAVLLGLTGVQADPQPGSLLCINAVAGSEKANVTLGAETWTWLDPKADASYSVSGDTITMKAGRGNDLWPDFNFDAPRLIKTVEGDFSIVVRVNGAPGPDFNGCGIVVQAAKDRVLRFLRGNRNGVHQIHMCAIENGKVVGEGEIPYTQTDCYLKIERRGAIFTGFARSIGSGNWQKVAQLTTTFPVRVQAGVALINEHNNGVFQASFSEIQFTGTDADTLVGVWTGRSFDDKVDGVWAIYCVSGTWKVLGRYYIGAQEVGGFDVESAGYANGHLLFNQVFYKRPVDTWSASYSVEAWLENGVLKFTWASGSDIGSSSLLRAR